MWFKKAWVGKPRKPGTWKKIWVGRRTIKKRTKKGLA